MLDSPEALDRATDFAGTFNLVLRERNTHETNAGAHQYMHRATCEWPAAKKVSAPEMAGEEAQVLGTDTRLRPSLADIAQQSGADAPALGNDDEFATGSPGSEEEAGETEATLTAEAKLRPRLADVALQAGVSPATASRVLTGSARVRPETRREVEEAIARLGYVRNRAPRSSASRRTGSIAFVVCEDNSRVFSEPFFPLMLRSISSELSSRGVQLVLLMAHSPRDYQIASRYLRSGHVDGAVLVSMHGRRPLDLRSLGVPVVLAGRPFGNDEEFSYVDADNVGGAKMAVQYLLKSGRTTIATVAGPPDMSPGVDRLRGYRMAMAEAGLSDPGLIVFGDFGRASAEHGVYRLLDRRPNIDAVFVASDLMAAGALRALRRTGRRVPEDVAVIGFEDSPLARHTDPKLTTVRQPIENMGERLASELLALIARGGQEPSHVVLETQLVIRESA